MVLLTLAEFWTFSHWKNNKCICCDYPERATWIELIHALNLLRLHFSWDLSCLSLCSSHRSEKKGFSTVVCWRGKLWWLFLLEWLYLLHEHHVQPIEPLEPVLGLLQLLSSEVWKRLPSGRVYILKNGQGSSCFALLGPGRFKFLKSLKDENDLACLFLSPCPSLSLDQSGSGSIWGKETYLTRVPMTILLAYKNFYLFLSIEFT